MTGAPRLWMCADKPAEPQGFVRAFLEVPSHMPSPFQDAVTVSFGDGMWIFLDSDGRMESTTWATLLTVADAVVEFDPTVQCLAAWTGPGDWKPMPEGQRPFRCVWPSPHPGPHLVRGLAWLPGADGEVILDACGRATE